MAERQFESGAAFHALLDLIRGADRSFLVGDRAVPDDVNVLEGYRWLIEVLGVGCDLYLWADPDRPEAVNHPTGVRLARLVTGRGRWSLPPSDGRPRRGCHVLSG